jgi:hypothetical protein
VLKHIVSYRRKKNIKKTKLGLQEGGKIKVYFMVNSLQAWKVEPVFELMLRDRDFDPYIIVVPSKVDGGVSAPDLYSFFKKKDYPTLRVIDDTGKAIDIWSGQAPDLVFFTDPYKNVDDQYYYQLSKKYLSCYVPYYFMATDHVGGASLIPNTLMMNALWRLYLPHEAVKSRFKRFSASRGKNATVVGYPGVEDLFKKIIGSNVNEVKNSWPSSNNKIKIIYAPHHSISWGDRSLSTFIENGQFIKSLVSVFKDEVFWSFKPHPNLKKNLYLHPEWGVDKTDKYYEFWEAQDCTQLDEGEYVDLFFGSSAIIHDCSSFIVEYAFTKKPALYLENENNITSLLNEFGKGVMSHYNKARRHNEIKEFVEKLITNELQFNPSDWEFVRDYISEYYEDKLPSKRITDDIKSSLGYFDRD